jgi:hypothetical protein
MNPTDETFEDPPWTMPEPPNVSLHTSSEGRSSGHSLACNPRFIAVSLSKRALRCTGWVAVLHLLAIVSGCNGFFVDPTLTTIAVTPPTPSIVQGNALQMTATGSYDDGSVKNITGQVTWTTSDQTRATVSSSGVVKGVNAGSSTISASSANISGTTTVSITLASLVSIQVSPSSTSAITGQTVPFQATGNFIGGGSADITDAVIWSTDNPNVSISNSASTNGQAQVNGPFLNLPVRVTIRATSGAISGTATLAVTQ